jgi:hypothetical protein
LRGLPASGAGRTVIRGQNYSAWRSGYRVRHGNGCWTFVALSTLGAIAIDSNEYYPYAYISAPETYCEGLTDDGCELIWQDVQTIEGASSINAWPTVHGSKATSAIIYSERRWLPDYSYDSRRLEMVLTVAHITPLVALIAGILILILPRLLNYIVAFYLIVEGVVGLNAIYHFIH